MLTGVNSLPYLCIHNVAAAAAARDSNDIWTAEELECSMADDGDDQDDGRVIPE
jgi:hypothetical protein